MAWGLGLGEAYYLVATLLQGGLAILLLTSGKLDRLKGGFALVLAVGASHTLSFLIEAGSGPDLSAVNRYTDTVLLITLAYLASQFPVPLGGDRGKRLATQLWAGSIAFWTLAYPLLLAQGGQRYLPYDLVDGLLHDGSFALIAGLFALHLIPRWQELGQGPLRRQTLLAGAGIAMSPLFQGGSEMYKLVMETSNFLDTHLTSAMDHGFWLLAGWFGLAAIARVLWSPAAEERGDRTVMAAALTLALVLGAYRRFAPSAVANEFAAQVLRPLLLAGAILLYDLFEVPETYRRFSMIATSLLVASASFLLISVLLSGQGLASEMLDPGIALAALCAVGLGTYVLRGPLSRLYKANEGPTSRVGRLQRYRLALEKERAQARASTDLDDVRERLGISEEEHRLIEAVVTGRDVVPLASLQGARPGDRVAHRYEVIRELGRGGAGRALLARDLAEGGLVVLKELARPWEAHADHRLSALHHEVEVGGQLDSPHVATIHDLVEDGIHAYLVREHIAGRPLSEVIEEEAPLEPARAMELIEAIARGLGDLHRAGLLHLDLKPGNVILDDTGRPVIIDLGTVRATHERSADATKTQAHGATGTLAWMAPEAILGEPLDTRTDLFALGALAYALLTGRHHVPVQAAAFVLEQEIVDGQPPGDAPAPWDGLVEALMRRDPDERLGSVDQVLARIEALSDLVTVAEDEKAHPGTDDVAR